MVEPVLTFYENSTDIRSLEWYDDNFCLHRDEDEPSQIFFYKTGEVESENWFKNGTFHRELGPAKIHYWPNGTALVEFYFLNGLLTRMSSAAEIWYHHDGKIMDMKWFRNGIKYDPLHDDTPIFLEKVVLTNEETHRK